MKPFITIIFFSFSLAVSGKPTLDLLVTHCKSEQKTTVHKLLVYKNNNLFQEFFFAGNEFHTILTDIELGVYRFEYETTFHEMVVDSINIGKDSIYWKSLCLDQFPNLSNNFTGYFEKLKSGDFFILEFISSGCHHWSTQKIKIIKSKETFYAYLYPQYRYKNATDDKFKRLTIKLTQTLIDSILKFQIDIYKNATGDRPTSTEETKFIFKFKGEVIKYNDSENGLARFHLLKQTLFQKE